MAGASARTRPPTPDRTACVRCSRDVRGGSWCNRCHDQVAAAVAARGHGTAGLARALDDLDDCECGRPKPLGEPSCSRCSWLDRAQDRGTVRSSVVRTLRGSRAMTVAEIVEASGCVRRNVVDALAELERSGRVARRDVEIEHWLGSVGHLYQLTS